MSTPDSAPPNPDWQKIYQPRSTFGKSVFGWALFIGLTIMLFVLLKTSQNPSADVALSDFTVQIENGNVRELSIEKDELTGEFVTPPASTNGMTRFRTTLPEGMGAQWPFAQWLISHRGQAKITATNNQSLLLQVVLPFIPWLLIFGFVWFFIFRKLRNSASRSQWFPPDGKQT
jgi:cell division protease FtsH